MSSDNTPTSASIRFAVEPRMVPVVKAARRLHLTAIEFGAKRAALEAIGFPVACPVTGHYDLKAIDAWMDARSGLAEPGTAMANAEATRILAQRIAARGAMPSKRRRPV